MENLERFTPLYAIAYAIMNSIENLRFDKEGYFHVLVFYGLFYKRNKNSFPCFHKLWKLKHSWKLGRTRNSSLETLSLQFLVLTAPTRDSVYNCMEMNYKRAKQT